MTWVPLGCHLGATDWVPFRPSWMKCWDRMMKDGDGDGCCQTDNYLARPPERTFDQGALTVLQPEVQRSRSVQTGDLSWHFSVARPRKAPPALARHCSARQASLGGSTPLATSSWC